MEMFPTQYQSKFTEAVSSCEIKKSQFFVDASMPYDVVAASENEKSAAILLCWLESWLSVCSIEDFLDRFKKKLAVRRGKHARVMFDLHFGPIHEILSGPNVEWRALYMISSFQSSLAAVERSTTDLAQCLGIDEDKRRLAVALWAIDESVTNDALGGYASLTLSAIPNLSPSILDDACEILGHSNPALALRLKPYFGISDHSHVVAPHLVCCDRLDEALALDHEVAYSQLWGQRAFLPLLALGRPHDSLLSFLHARAREKTTPTKTNEAAQVGL